MFDRIILRCTIGSNVFVVDPSAPFEPRSFIPSYAVSLPIDRSVTAPTIER
jgi:hypothetical protein